MNYLEPDAIQAINEIVVEESGGSIGMREYGYKMTVTDKEIENYTIFIATTNPDLANISAWIKKHSRKSN